MAEFDDASRSAVIITAVFFLLFAYLVIFVIYQAAHIFHRRVVDPAGSLLLADVPWKSRFSIVGMFFETFTLLSYVVSLKAANLPILGRIMQLLGLNAFVAFSARTNDNPISPSSQYSNSSSIINFDNSTSFANATGPVLGGSSPLLLFNGIVPAMPQATLAVATAYVIVVELLLLLVYFIYQRKASPHRIGRFVGYGSAAMLPLSWASLPGKWREFPAYVRTVFNKDVRDALEVQPTQIAISYGTTIAPRVAVIFQTVISIFGLTHKVATWIPFILVGWVLTVVPIVFWLFPRLFYFAAQKRFGIVAAVRRTELLARVALYASLLSCTYDEDGIGYLDIAPQQRCWTGIHWFVAMMALFGLFSQGAAIVLIIAQASLYLPSKGPLDVAPGYNAARTVYLFLCGTVSVFFYNRHPMAVCVFFLLCTIADIFMQLLIRPSAVSSINYLRFVLSATVASTSIGVMMVLRNVNIFATLAVFVVPPILFVNLGLVANRVGAFDQRAFPPVKRSGSVVYLTQRLSVTNAPPASVHADTDIEGRSPAEDRRRQLSEGLLVNQSTGLDNERKMETFESVQPVYVDEDGVPIHEEEARQDSLPSHPIGLAHSQRTPPADHNENHPNQQSRPDDTKPPSSLVSVVAAVADEQPVFSQATYVPPNDRTYTKTMHKSFAITAYFFFTGTLFWTLALHYSLFTSKYFGSRFKLPSW